MRLMIYLCFAFALPHGDVHDQINALTQTITQFPDSTTLYLHRGELFLLDENFAAAKTDFSTCLQSGMNSPRVFLDLSKLMESLHMPDSAIYYVDLALERDGNDCPSLEWKGSLMFGMERYCESAEIYSRLISLAYQASPALYMDASFASRNCPKTSLTADEILIKGMSRLGRLHVLEQELVRVYLSEKKYEEALAVQTDIIDHWAVKIRPYYERAEIYLLAGNKPAAIDDLNSALRAMKSLPAYKSSTPAMQELRSKIDLTLHQTGS